MRTARKPYPTGVTGDERAFVAPDLTPMREDAAPREHDLREVLNAVRRLVRTGPGGGSCRTISRRGRRCTSRPGGGWRPGTSRR